MLLSLVPRSSPAYEYESSANRDKFYRHVSEGGWPFSTSAHGWPISDCTGEGLKGVLCLVKGRLVSSNKQDHQGRTQRRHVGAHLRRTSRKGSQCHLDLTE